MVKPGESSLDQTLDVGGVNLKGGSGGSFKVTNCDLKEWKGENNRFLSSIHALRLAKYFGVSARFWMGLQMDYDLDMAADALSEKIERDVQAMTA